MAVMVVAVLLLAAVVPVAWRVSGQDSTEAKQFSCYNCNSAYGPDCGRPFNKTTGEKFLVDCNAAHAKPEGAKDKQAVGCRIIDLQLLKESRIIRECAYSGDDVDHLKKPGSKGVVSYITQCSESRCNSAMQVSLGSCLSILLPIAAAMLLRH